MCGEARSRDPRGDHRGIAQDRSAGAQRLLGGGAESRRGAHVGDEIDHAARVDHAHDGPFEGGIEPIEVGLGADRGNERR